MNFQIATKPLLRGHFHQAAFFIAVGACAMLTARAKTSQALVSGLVYSSSLLAMFGVSALYHRPNWSPRWRGLLKRLDHSAIFLLIAGTTTPICLLAMSPTDGFRLLTATWIAASLGVAKSVLWAHSPKWVSALLYVLVGWISVTYARTLLSSLGTGGFWYLLTGGIAYSIGAVVYALRRPDPYPRHFGYHEVFHVFVIIGAVLHFLAVAPLIK